MEKIRYLVLDEPALYLLGALVAVLLFTLGLSLNQAATVMFWWYVACSATVGLYVTWCDFTAFLMSLVDRDTPSGWNWENRPSIQELKKEDPAYARVLAEMWDQLDQTMWRGALRRLFLVLTMFASLPLGAYFLRQSMAGVAVWGESALALVLLTYGFIMHHRYHR